MGLAWALLTAWGLVAAGAAVSRQVAAQQRRALLAAAGVAALGSLGFLWLARAWQGPEAWPWDQAAAEAARAAWSATGLRTLGALTHLADRWTMWVIGLVGAALLAWRRDRLLLPWAVVLLGNAAWTPLLKAGFDRVRPTADLSGLLFHGPSFPSGHSSGAMVVYGMLAWVACRRAPPAWRLPLVLAATAVVVLVGASRVYLQAHYLSDVLGGFAAGGAWLALGVAGWLLLSPRVAERRL